MDNFDWKTYINNYVDLQNAKIDTKEKAFAHWNKYGKKEGRTFTKIDESNTYLINIRDIAIITANFGNYDENNMNLGFVKNYYFFDWYYITDTDITDSFWKILRCNYHNNIKKIHNDDKNRMYSKFYKTQALNIDIFKKYKYLIWMDASYKITNYDIVSDIINLIKNNQNDFFIFEHYKRNTFQEEFDESIKNIKKYNNQQLKNQVDKYIQNTQTYKLYESSQ
jgi:hypothetical protein